MIAIVGIGHGAISHLGKEALSKAHCVLVTGEFSAADLQTLAPRAQLVTLQTSATFLARRDSYYAAVADEVRALATSHGDVVVPVAGNPFFLEGIASALRTGGSETVIFHPAQSVVDALFEHFPRLIAGGGYRVIDTSESFFTCLLDPGCDLVLVQLARAGSKRQTFDYTPSAAWLRDVFRYIARSFPPHALVSTIELMPSNVRNVATVLSDACEHGLSIGPWSTVVVSSPWKQAQDTEEEILSRLVSPLDRYLREPA